MVIMAPDYYGDFACIAGACRHSCCIGWEIDVDAQTLSRYDAVSGAFGQRLQQNICREETAHFRLDETERCPFLNCDGLCDIILHLGEDALCQICDDHPRFRNFFSEREEVGLGLCCEAAAQMIVKRQKKTVFVPIEGTTQPLFPKEEAFLSLRQQVFDVLQNREKPIFARLDEMLKLCGSHPFSWDASFWAQTLLSLEKLDDERDRVLHRVLEHPEAELPKEQWIELALEQLAVYFAYRHLADSLDDDRLPQRAAFCAMSVRMIAAMAAAVYGANLQPDDLAETARLYSAEVEYSPDNMEALLEIL